MFRLITSMLSFYSCVAAVFMATATLSCAEGLKAQPILIAQAKNPTLSDILPAGKGLPLLLENCGSCHSTACAVKGQRPKGRWLGLKKDHKERVAGLSDEEFDTLFSYLSENFNNSKPEPKLTPEMLEMATCTPF